MFIKSMTAFSRSEKSFKKIKIYIEIKTLNNRYLDVRINQPSLYNPFHNKITKIIGSKFSRGGFDVYIKREVLSQDYLSLTFNEPQADKAYEILKNIKNKYSLKGDISLSDMAPFDIVQNRNILSEKDLEEEWLGVSEVLEESLEKINEMRLVEGKNLWSDIEKRLLMLQDSVNKIEGEYSGVVNDYSARILERINKVCKKISKETSIDLDDPRFQLEFGYIAERCDITEELTRLNSHIKEFGKLSKDSDSVGRKMDFLLQEMNREVNTIASKNIDKDIAILTVEMRAEVEKIRQQVQNIE